MLNVIFLILYIIAANLFSGTALYVLCTLHLLICVILHLRQKESYITPIFTFYIGVIIVNIANIALISKIGTVYYKTYSYIIPKYIDEAARIWCISSILFIMGYQFVLKKSLPAIDFELKKKIIIQNLFWLLLIVNALSLIGYGINLKGTQVGRIFGMVNSIGILFYARLWAKEDNKTYRFYALSLFIVETYIALTTSFLRFELILPTFYLFAGYFIGKGHVRYIFSYRIIPLLLIIMIFSSVFSSLQSNRANFISVFSEENSQNAVNENSSALLDRSANVAQITNIVNLVKRNGFYNGRASAPIITALIPRAIWPDKPLIQLGIWFALEIGAAYKAENGRVNNSINMTVAGELYLDFGWLGVALGSFLFGAFIGLLWNSTRFYSSEYNISGTIFGGYIFILSIGSYADLQIVITLLSTYLIFLALKKFVFKGI